MPKKTPRNCRYKDRPNINADTMEGRLTLARHAKRLTQREAGEHIGRSGAAYSTYENGTCRPSIAMLEPLAKLFGVTPEYILLGKTEQVSPPASSPAPRAAKPRAIKPHPVVPATDDEFTQVFMTLRSKNWTPAEAATLKAVIDMGLAH